MTDKQAADGFLLHTASSLAWRRVGYNRRCGVLVPLFSVYSRESLGIADLADLRMLINWVQATGSSILQLLPMNEVGSVFCPYDAVSSFALEPMYLSLEGVLPTDNIFVNNRVSQVRQKFSRKSGRVDYAIKREKLEIFWDIYCACGPEFPERLAQFRRENAYWIEDFALYKAIKNHQQGKPWYEWDIPLRNHDKQALAKFSRDHEQEIDFQVWLQWLLWQQFRSARAHAASKHVLLKGDLPVLVSRDSADVWAHPEFFKLEYAAGAPPDMYCAKGQRWGMPTYDWERIAQDGFLYLKEKLRYAQNFYDILRVDHVVGLFRIWSIPYTDSAENQGLHGVFDPQDETRWGEHGHRILSLAAQNTEMLLCAEDLGIIPKACTDTLRELGIPGNDVQRWVKDWNVRHDFLQAHEYRELSVAMLSTHDTTNWPAWWENEAGTIDEDLFVRKCRDRHIDYEAIKEKLFDVNRSRHGRLRWKEEVDSPDKLLWYLGKRREEVGDFIELYQNSYHEKEKLWIHLGLNGPMREKSDKEIIRQALALSLASKAIFCINTINDWLYVSDIFPGDPYEYRINTPGTVSDRNWSLLLPFSLEEMVRHPANKEVHAMIASSGRA